MISLTLSFCFFCTIYCMAGMFYSGKVWQNWRVACDLPNFNQPNFSLLMVSLWPKSIHSLNIILPNTFNSAIRQTLTLPNIPDIRYHYSKF